MAAMDRADAADEAVLTHVLGVRWDRYNINPPPAYESCCRLCVGPPSVVALACIQTDNRLSSARSYSTSQRYTEYREQTYDQMGEGIAFVALSKSRPVTSISRIVLMRMSIRRRRKIRFNFHTTWTSYSAGLGLVRGQ